MDIAMRIRMPAAPIRFDGARATWSLGDHEIRASEISGKAVRFQLYRVKDGEALVGTYSGTVGAATQEIAQYLVYFLETGKPWHHGLAKKGLV
jgi:hypothetical protein